MSGTAAASARRLETYTRVSLYVMFALLPLAYLGAFPAWNPVVGLLVGAVQAVANVVVCHRCLTMLHQGRRRPTGHEALFFAGWLVLTVAVLILVITHLEPTRTWMPALWVAGAAPLAAVAPLLPIRTVLATSLIGGAVLGLVAALRVGLPTDAAIGFALGAALLLTFLGLTFWLTGWMLRNIWELEEARRAATQLAIAQERLRISRDLHDLFGRTMATVALKSELAGELVRRGRPDAALTQLSEVRNLAEQTGQQVRAVVQGYRSDDLGTELQGARSLLDSAGTRCVVRGTPPDGLDPQVLSALVWVLREAVTNVIRHSSASECLITIEHDDDQREVTLRAHGLRMIITNDGAPPVGDHGPVDDRLGHGLIGMRERLQQVGGRLVTTHSPDAGRFTIEVTVPGRPETRQP